MVRTSDGEEKENERGFVGLNSSNNWCLVSGYRIFGQPGHEPFKQYRFGDDAEAIRLCD